MSIANNVFLIGMPGAGKSTVGRHLARAMGLEFIDADEALVARNGVSIATIFEIEGEAGFRAREAAILEELTQREGIVLATGGGAVLREENRAALSARGLTVYLSASLETLLSRTRSESIGRSVAVRPLLAVAESSRADVLAHLLEVRVPLYNATAHLAIDANLTQRTRFVRELASRISETRLALDGPTS